MPRLSVAIINTSEDVAASLADALADLGEIDCAIGYVVDFREGRVDLGDFLRRHDPRVIVWDIALPYARNWRYFADEVQKRPDCAGRTFVLTTTNKRVLDEMVGATDTFEIVGKPYDLALIADAVHRAAVKMEPQTANGPRH